jgi:hypothetical protein
VRAEVAELIADESVWLIDAIGYYEAEKVKTWCRLWAEQFRKGTDMAPDPARLKENLDPAAIMAEHDSLTRALRVARTWENEAVAKGTRASAASRRRLATIIAALAEAQEQVESEARCRRSNSRSARLLIDTIGRDEPEVVAANAAVEAGDWSDDYDFGHIAIAYITRLRSTLAEAQEREQRVRAVADSHALVAALPAKPDQLIMVPAITVAEDIYAAIDEPQDGAE